MGRCAVMGRERMTSGGGALLCADTWRPVAACSWVQCWEWAQHIQYRIVGVDDA